MDLKKNDIIELYIEDIATGGEGVGKLSGFPFFVKNAVPGDEVKAVITKLKKSYGYAKTVEVLNQSPNRVKPPCPHAARCGGCSIMHIKYDEQLRIKENLVKNNLMRIGGIDVEYGIEFMPISGMDEPYRYRNKAQFPVGLSSDDRIISGFFAGRTHYIIEMDDCTICMPEVSDIMKAVREFAEKNGISAYDEKTGTGVIRHVLIRKGFKTGQIMVCMVINDEGLSGFEDKFVKALRDIKGFGNQIASVCLNINRKKTNVILGDRTVNIFGPGYIEDKIEDLTFRISAASFFQVNGIQTEKLYKKALEFAELTGDETVFDLYCGTGTISLFLARHSRHVYGIESVSDAISDAKANAEVNGISNVSFYCEKAEVLFAKMCGENGGSGQLFAQLAQNKDDSESRRISPDVVVLDPPRKGCDKALLDAICNVAPEKIVYVSCDSATLARDLSILSDYYKVKKIAPVDMFPHTMHVETVVKLSQKHIDHSIRVELDLDEFDETPTELRKKATYKEIKQYILDTHGKKVSTLYISQIKRKCGLEVGKCYNKPKSERVPAPVCPPDKEELIMDALRHFKLID